MNSLLNNNNVMMKAFSAMMSGQSPQQFLMSMAQSNPQLQGLDFTNLEKTANDLCAKNGQDINQLKANITQEFANLK